VLEHSPADHVRRPNVPPESPTLGFTHLQFDALLTAARESANDYDFALVAMLELLGLRIFEATGASIADLGEEHGHRVLRVCGKGAKIVLVPLPPAVAGPSTGPSRTGPAARSCSTAAVPGWTGTPPPAACATWSSTRAHGSPGHTPTCSGTPWVTTMLDAGVDLRDVQIAARHRDPRTTTRYDRARQNLDRHPQLHPRRLHGLRHLTPQRLP
jgi:integrase/recombinase XerD